MNDPESLVRAFIGDYCRWSVRADELCATYPFIEAMEQADAEYTELLSRYCRADVYRQNIAFGSPPIHAPETEQIRSTTIDSDRAIVKTTNTAHSGFEADYEYLFVLIGDRWFLEAIDYVTDEGRYPCL